MSLDRSKNELFINPWNERGMWCIWTRICFQIEIYLYIDIFLTSIRDRLWSMRRGVAHGWGSNPGFSQMLWLCDAKGIKFKQQSEEPERPMRSVSQWVKESVVVDRKGCWLSDWSNRGHLVVGSNRLTAGILWVLSGRAQLSFWSFFHLLPCPPLTKKGRRESLALPYTGICGPLPSFPVYVEEEEILLWTPLGEGERKRIPQEEIHSSWTGPGMAGHPHTRAESICIHIYVCVCICSRKEEFSAVVRREVLFLTDL